MLITHPDHEKRKQEGDFQGGPNTADGPEDQGLDQGIGQHDGDGPQPLCLGDPPGPQDIPQQETGKSVIEQDVAVRVIPDFFLQNKKSVYEIEWAPGFTYGDVRLEDELQNSVYNFEMANIEALWTLFGVHEQEAQRLLEAYNSYEQKSRFPLLSAYDHVLKCSNLFNLLDSRGAISVTERVGVIGRVRKIAIGVAQAWVDQHAPVAEEVA